MVSTLKCKCFVVITYGINYYLTYCNSYAAIILISKQLNTLSSKMDIHLNLSRNAFASFSTKSILPSTSCDSNQTHHIFALQTPFCLTHLGSNRERIPLIFQTSVLDSNLRCCLHYKQTEKSTPHQRPPLYVIY